MTCQRASRRIPSQWILILLAGLWSLILTSCQSPQTGQETPSYAQKQATLDYWNELYSLRLQLNQSATGLGASLEKDSQNGGTITELLPKFAKDFEALVDAYDQSVTQLPVMNVDERLIKETADDLRSDDEEVKNLNAMADAGVAYADWSQRKNHPGGGKLFSEMVDSYIRGLEGRPFAGYDKVRAERASLDAEGQQIIEAYLEHAQAFNSLIEQSRADDVKELELRAYLAKKYGAEFRPMPKAESDSHTN